MESPIVRRIRREAGGTDWFEALAQQLPPADLQSLLLEVFRRRAHRVTPAAVMARAARGGLVAPADVDARLLHRLDACAFEAAREFEAIDPSPVLPFGAELALGGTDQNNVLTSLRNTEVPGDPTVALAIEAARRRRELTRLCASQRVARLQSFDFPGFTPHFRLFALVSAGRDRGSLAFECSELREHIRVYLALMRLAERAGFLFAAPRVELSDALRTRALLRDAGIAPEEVARHAPAHRPGAGEAFLASRGIRLAHERPDDARAEAVRSHALAPLAAEFPEAEFAIDTARLEGLQYYDGWRLRIAPRAPDGARYPIIDGGFTAWTARLMQDRKQRLLISGLGSEFACRKYTGTSPQ